MQQYDVIVVGGGNAALCAALAARHRVSRVLLLERAPQHMRGGNTRHTRNVRCAGDANTYSSEPYREEEFLEDLTGVSGQLASVDFAKFTIRESRTLPQWMSEHGISWQPPLAGTLHLGRTNRWFLGGGKALVNAYFETASKMGIEVRYNACVEDLLIEDGKFSAVLLKDGDTQELIYGRAVVIAAVGFEANIGWLKRYWGEAANNFCVRGTPYNDGKMWATLWDKGAKSVGDPKGFHAVAIDARAPKFDGGIVTRLDCVPFSIVVGSDGRRFYDEGQDFWPKRYAIWGLLVANRPDQIAYSIIDTKSLQLFMPSVFPPVKANSVAELASKLGLDVA